MKSEKKLRAKRFSRGRGSGSELGGGEGGAGGGGGGEEGRRMQMSIV